MNETDKVTEALKISDLYHVIPAWECLSQVYGGVGRRFPRNDFLMYSKDFVERTIESQGTLTEEGFFLMILNADIVSYEIVCKHTSKVWEPQQESFDSFTSKRAEVVITFLTDSSLKIKQTYDWLIKLCDWSATSSKKQEKNSLH